ncbi:MAG TPA: hypothetical protein VJ464_02970 [Blastocatellia bacterium]|nr:hypothetical protein [Blastocatellia bacterium]
MKTCPECGIALRDEYQFCPEDGATLSQTPASARIEESPSAKSQAVDAVVLYCPACAAEYPLTFTECPVHHTALTTHGMPTLVEGTKGAEKDNTSAAGDARTAKSPAGRRLHLVSDETHSRRSALEAYEETLENLAQPPVKEASAPEELPSAVAPDDDARRHRLLAIGIVAALVVLALLGLYAVISNASRRPTPSTTKPASAKTISQQPSITIQTPQTASDYQNQASVNPPPADVSSDSGPARAQNVEEPQPKTPRHIDEAPPAARRATDAHTQAETLEPGDAPARHPQQAVSAQTPTTRQPAATELILPRGTFGLVTARLAGVRAARTAGGYRYDLTFHMADHAGHATQWERLAIVTRSTSGATRQQQIPFFHRLGADGTLSFTVSVEMPGRGPADWQGRIICTSIGSDSSGKPCHASFGANVSPD